MSWPDIFFKARKPRPEPELPPPFKAAPESPKPAAAAPLPPQPPTIKPVPVVTLGPQATPNPLLIKTASTATSTRTLPAMHGVVLRPPARVVIGPPATPAAPAPPPAPMKNIEQLMAEADPVRTLSQTGSVRLLKRLAPDPEPAKAPAQTPAEPAPVKSEPSPSSTAAPSPEPAAPVSPSPWPSYQPATTPAAPIPPTLPLPGEAPKPEENDSPFLLKTAATPESTAKVIPPTAPHLMPLVSVFRRKAKMADIARIVLPPRREETQQLHTPPGSSPTVVPPAFPVAAMSVRAAKTNGENPEPPAAPASSVVENPFLERTPAEGGIAEVSKTEVMPPADAPRIDPTPEPSSAPEAPRPEATEPPSVPVPLFEEKPPAPAPDFAVEAKVDPEAHKPEPTAEPLPKVDPEAHRPPPPPAPPVPSTELSTPSVPQEKREFHLANGERVAGVVLSETPEAIYIEHSSLGVVAIPRAQIAKRLVEIILINGDRIVGDIMAETADTLYVRHASLGMLTVPRTQRSTRVVEAILKDGDRILGEVLTETDTFTVIRSATLGTVTVPHTKMAMLNRKIEQIEMKSLPPPAPELQDKPSE